jgi:regulator of RNase E activity RraA
VSVSGLRLAPGDVIHGDANGIITIPARALPTLAESARRVLVSEAEVISFLERDPLPLDELKARFFTHGYR